MPFSVFTAKFPKRPNMWSAHIFHNNLLNFVCVQHTTHIGCNRMKGKRSKGTFAEVL